MRLHLGPIATSSVQTMAVYGLRLILQLALLLLIARYLGPRDFGEFAGIAALAFGLGTLSSFGLGFAVLSESAKSPETGQKILSQGIPATFASAAILLPIYLWLALFAIGSEAGLLPLLLIGVAELLLIPLVNLRAFRLQGLGAVPYSQIVLLWPMGLRLAGLTLCLVTLPVRSLEIYAGVHVVGALAALAIVSIYAKEAARWPARPQIPDPSTLRSGMRYALMNLTTIAPGEVDKVLALRLVGPHSTGLYALASRGLALVTLPVLAMLQAALPRLIRELGEKTSGGRRLNQTVLILAALYGMGAGGLLYFFMPPLIEWLLGPGYQGIREIVSKIAFIAPFLTLRLATGVTIFALGQPVIRAVIEGSAILLLILLALFLTPQYGVNGLILSVVISEASMAGFGMIYISRTQASPSRHSTNLHI